MDSSRRWGIALRLVFLVSSTALLGALLSQTSYYAVSTLAAIILVLQLTEFLRYTTAADRELARIIEALAQGDLSDRPLVLGRQGADPPLARAFATALTGLKERSIAADGERLRLQAMVEHSPVPLLGIEADHRVELLNRAARRFFQGIDITKRADLIRLAPDLAPALEQPVARRMVRVALPRGLQRCLVSAVGNLAGSRRTILLSLQNIEGELEESELRAWEDLVRVLAHEIMNSLTPAASLAQTAGLLVEDLRDEIGTRPALVELGEAVDAIHRRSAGLMRFVDNYRRFAEPPAPLARPVQLAELFDRAGRLAGPALAGAGVTLQTRIDPVNLGIQADPDLLDQALVNLIKNGIEAVEHCADKRVGLAAELDPAGRIVLTIADSGPGLPEGLTEQIFVPFFTTKAKGSGIGLTMVRQIMLAHGGMIEAVSGQGEDRFRLRF